MTEFEPVIGMEVHVESKTKTKMFCSCANGLGLEKEANLNICPICTAHPGTLPVPNKQALINLAAFGLALKCQIPEYTWFERKSYFYPDLPKGYQITQYERPLCAKGVLPVMLDGKIQKIAITRIHMEEDTGKLSHRAGTNTSLVDYNRAGVPLMELVTEPDMRSGKEARLFCEELQLILRYLNVSDADMERGQMRCEVNVSIRKKGTTVFGTKVEIKNLNSFKAVERSIDYEIKRQSELLNKGEVVLQETRGWDDVKGVTVSQRNKENAAQYRYFLEPDIPPFYTQELVLEAEKLLIELPFNKRNRFKEEYTIPEKQIDTLVQDKFLAEYFEQIVSELKEWYKEERLGDLDESKLIQLGLNYLLTEITKRQYAIEGGFAKANIPADNFAEFIGIVAQKTISSSAAQTVLEEMFRTGGDPGEIIQTKNLSQLSDETEIVAFVTEAIKANQKSVEDYHKGSTNAVQYLVGQVMKLSQGKANPVLARELLLKQLSNSNTNN